MDGLKEQLKIFSCSFSEKKLREIFERIWSEYYPKIMVFIQVSFNISDSEDLVQEIMLKVYKNLSDYNPVFSFNTWIFKIARNHVIDRLKKSATEERTIRSLKSDYNISEFNKYGSPESLQLKEVLKKDIQIFIEKLPTPERQVSYLRFYEELKYPEISRITGMPVGTVKSHVHNIRKKLKNYYGDEYEN